MAVRWTLLDDLDAADRRRVLGRLQRRTFAAGEIVFHEGDLADTIHFVVEGRVVASRSSVDGDRFAYAVVGPGEAFGEMAMLAPDRRRSATIQAVEATVTRALGYDDFERLRAGHPRIERLLVRLLADRVARLTDGLMEALHVPAQQRVARRIVDLCGIYAVGPGPGRSIPQGASPSVRLPLTQTDLADLCGVTRPTANRILRLFEGEGAVELARGAVVVRDLGAVRRAAGAAYRPRH